VNTIGFASDPYFFEPEGILRQQLKRLENCAQWDGRFLTMTIETVWIATIVLVLIGVGFITRWLVVSARADKGVMSPAMKTLTVVFGGMAVMVVAVVGGVGITMAVLGHEDYMFLVSMPFGAVIGLVVGVTIWVWLGYMVCREKNAARNEVILDDSTT
jgi:hypothetical protein